MLSKKCFFRGLAFVLVAVFSCFLTGCKGDDSVLSFSELSALTLEFDTDVRPFFNTLVYKYNITGDADIVSAATENITTLSYEMGESFKSLNSAMAEIELNETDDSSVTSDSGSINLINNNLNFNAKMNNERTHMSITLKNVNNESVYEIIKLENGKFLVQIVVKNDEGNKYTVYQISYKGTTGTLAIGFAEESYNSIFGAEIKDENFPSVSEKVYFN